MTVVRFPVHPLILVGLPGAGKSTIGRFLARRLGVAHVDADDVVAERLGMPIRAYFEQHGEAAFREAEAAVLADLVQRGGIVLSTGGGAVLLEENRTLLRASGTVVYLSSTPEDIYRRLRHDQQRPLLQVRNPLGRLRELYATRDPLYREVAHFVIETGRPPLHTLVNMVLMQLELAGLMDMQQVPSPVH